MQQLRHHELVFMGEGFNVVASEIKELSHQTAEAAEKIKNHTPKISRKLLMMLLKR